MSVATSEWVLVVDDNAAGRYAVSRMLRRGGYHVREAGTGNEALALAAQRPRLVLLDVHLPDLDGHEVCRRLRADPATHDLPILQMSASYVKGTDVARGLAGGADAYLVEPIDPEQLLATVSTLLRLRDAEKRARIAEADWAASFEAIRHGVCLIDARGRIARHNPAFAQAVTGAAVDLRGSSLASHLASAFPDLDLPDGGLPVGRTEIRDGERVWMATADEVGSGERGRRVLVLEDVTEQAVQRRELARSNADLESFAYVASHDMREPLRAIHSFIQLLDRRLGPSLDEDTRQMFGFVQNGAARLEEMIDGLLAYARLHMGEDTGPVSLEEAVAKARENLQSQIEERGARLLVSDLPVVRGSASALVQLFQNLIENGIKFCSGSPVIRVESVEEDGLTVMEVTDNGRGVPVDERSRIFEMFRRSDPDGGVPGTGVGLAICQRIVQAHGGRIWVEDAEGGGSRFRFTLSGVTRSAR